MNEYTQRTKQAKVLLWTNNNNKQNDKSLSKNRNSTNYEVSSASPGNKTQQINK